jgi:hypothetical protein
LNAILKKPLGPFAGFNHRADDGIAVNFGQAFDRPDRVSFQEHSQAENQLLFRQATSIDGPSRFIGESLPAFIAAKPLRTVSISTEPTHLILADGAIHDEPPFQVAAVRLEWHCDVAIWP